MIRIYVCLVLVPFLVLVFSGAVSMWWLLVFPTGALFLWYNVIRALDRVPDELCDCCDED